MAGRDSPYAAAVAIATALADPEPRDETATGESILRSYAADGVDVLKIAYAACVLLSEADRRLCLEADVARGTWLRRQGQRVARLLTAS